MTRRDAWAIDDAPAVEGLQAQRTVLAWRRTTLGLVANAALLSVHLLHASGPAPTAAAAALAVLVAAGTAVHARHRETALRRRPLPRPLATRTAPVLLGVGVVALAVTSGVVLMI